MRAAALPFFLLSLFLLTAAQCASGSDQQPSPPPPLTCAKGLEGPGNRQRFWDTTTDSTNIPAIVDMFSSSGRLHVIINTKSTACPGCHAVDWHGLAWRCEYGDGSVETAPPPKADPHNHSLIVSCKLRLSTAEANHPNQPVRVSITAYNTPSSFSDSGVTATVVEYPNVAFCRYPYDRSDASTHFNLRTGAVEHHYKHNLGACTSVAGAHLYRVPEWVTYHLQQGWQHFYIYVNEDPTAARALLAPFIESGLLDVIDFQSPPGSRTFSQQQAAENSCLARYRGLARWVAMADVDEFFQSMAPAVTVAAWLAERHVGLANSSGFAFTRVKFGGSGYSATELQIAETRPEGAGSPLLAVSEFVFRGVEPDTSHTKNIVMPVLVGYYSVHEVTLGLPTTAVNAQQDGRVVHYKTPASQKHRVLDTSMCVHATALLRALVRFGFDTLRVPDAAWSKSYKYIV
ncbi:MAG: hypothetical protein WDW38_007443 [Sanguina aurantia]